MQRNNATAKPTDSDQMKDKSLISLAFFPLSDPIFRQNKLIWFIWMLDMILINMFKNPGRAIKVFPVIYSNFFFSFLD